MEETKDKKEEKRQRDGDGEGERQRLKKQRMIRYSHMFYDVVYDTDDIK